MYVYFERQLLQQIENQVLLFKSFHSIPQRILFNCGITHFFSISSMYATFWWIPLCVRKWGADDFVDYDEYDFNSYMHMIPLVLPNKGVIKNIFFGLPIDFKSIHHGITFKKLKWKRYATCIWVNSLLAMTCIIETYIGTMNLGMT